MSGPRHYQQPRSGSWRIVAIVGCGVLLIAGLVGYRMSRGDVAPAATAQLDAGALDDFKATQQQLVDELQMTRDRLSRQQAQIRKLTLDLEDMSQKMDTLRNSFASDHPPVAAASSATFSKR